MENNKKHEHIKRNSKKTALANTAYATADIIAAAANAAIAVAVAAIAADAINAAIASAAKTKTKTNRRQQTKWKKNKTYSKGQIHYFQKNRKSNKQRNESHRSCL